MSGDDKVRFCGLCNLNVYNISAMTGAEAEQLIVRTEGRLCAKLYRRTDGTIITADCPVGWRALKRRASFVAGATLSALLSLFGGATAQQQQQAASKEKAVDECRNQVTIKRAVAETLPEERRAMLSGKILDVIGGGIPLATLTLVEETTKEKHATITTEDGSFQIPKLPAGTYRLEIAADLGFFPLTIEKLALRPEEAVRLDAVLSVAEMLSGIVNVLSPDDLIQSGRKPGETVMKVDGVIIRYDD